MSLVSPQPSRALAASFDECAQAAGSLTAVRHGRGFQRGRRDGSRRKAAWHPYCAPVEATLPMIGPAVALADDHPAIGCDEAVDLGVLLDTVRE